MKFQSAAAGERPVEVDVPVRLAACHAARQRARRGKKPNASQLDFDARWPDRLQTLCMTLREGGWQPARTASFVVPPPKTREIHAPNFADRVVHHLLVKHSVFARLPRLQRYFTLQPDASLSLNMPACWQVSRHRAKRCFLHF